MWSLVVVMVVVAGGASCADSILRRQGDYFLRLGREEGRLVMDEGDIIEEPQENKRSKRIAHPKEYTKYLQDTKRRGVMMTQRDPRRGIMSDPMDPRQNEVILEEARPDPGRFDGIKGMLETGSVDLLGAVTPSDMGLGEIYKVDKSNCLEKYLCEISRTAPHNLLMEETALLAMAQSQSEITNLLQSNLSEENINHRFRRSQHDLEVALIEATQVGTVCREAFPSCSISRLDILRVYKAQKENFCRLPLPYGM